jgi:hypothetical protein
MCGHENKAEDREHEKIKYYNHEIKRWRVLNTSE